MIETRNATIKNDIFRELDDLTKSMSNFMNESDFRFLQLLKNLDKLAKVDAVSASEGRALLYAVAGNIQKMDYWLNNMDKLGSKSQSFHSEFRGCVNLGLFSRAARIFPEIISIEQQNIKNLLNLGLTCASFGTMLSRAEAASRANLELPDMARQTLDTAMQSKAALDKLGISEQDVQAVLDIAGEILREKKLFWQNLVHISIIDSEEGVGLLYQLEVCVDIPTASSMTDDVLMRMVDRDLDKPGIAFSFLPLTSRNTP